MSLFLKPYLGFCILRQTMESEKKLSEFVPGQRFPSTLSSLPSSQHDCTNESPASPPMSNTHTPSSSNFQLIFNSALKAYEKHTKNDLLAHPLAAELQSCSSPTAILAVLHQQVQDLNRSQRSNERLTKFLDPTVHVLYPFSV